MTGFLVFCAILAVICIISSVCDARRICRFKEKYPPISDKEFADECKPGTNPSVAIRVRHIIAEQLGIPIEHVHPETKFIEML